jgi:uncharacterized protein
MREARIGTLSKKVRGAGLGLRRGLIDALQGYTAPLDEGVRFLEVAPENWLRVGGRLGKQFRAMVERYPFVTHGLSLSIGSPAPLDVAFVRELKGFLDRHGIEDYSEHLTFCSDDGHLYDLMPIPFTDAAVDFVADRVRQVQDILERRIALENASYYAPLATELSEAQFISAVIERADCDLLLDVNNIVVNRINHGYDATPFLDQLPLDRVRYVHIAGHYVEAPDLRVDTHGSAVGAEAWTLLEALYARIGPVPTLLERDFNLPPFAQLLNEIGQITTRQAHAHA